MCIDMTSSWTAAPGVASYPGHAFGGNFPSDHVAWVRGYSRGTSVLRMLFPPQELPLPLALEYFFRGRMPVLGRF